MSEITFNLIKVDKELKDVKEKFKLHEASINSKVNHTEEKGAVLKNLLQPEPKSYIETTSASENNQESDKLEGTKQT